MTNARILKKKVHEMANGTEYPDNGAGDFIEDGSEAVDEDIEQMEEEAGRFRWMPWVGIAAGIAVVAGAIYLSRHRAQRMLVKKGLQKGLQGGAVLRRFPDSRVRAPVGSDPRARRNEITVNRQG
jgi:hypothetical protein